MIGRTERKNLELRLKLNERRANSENRFMNGSTIRAKKLFSEFVDVALGKLTEKLVDTPAPDGRTPKQLIQITKYTIP